MVIPKCISNCNNLIFIFFRNSQCYMKIRNTAKIKNFRVIGLSRLKYYIEHLYNERLEILGGIWRRKIFSFNKSDTILVLSHYANSKTNNLFTN